MREHLRLADGDGGVALDELGHHPAWFRVYVLWIRITDLRFSAWGVGFRV